MKIKNYVFIGIGVFSVIVALAVGISTRFSLPNITSDAYSFIENFFSRWSPALAAAGTIILALSIFFFIYENRRREEREKKQAIHALHDEIQWNLTNIITLRYQISNWLKRIYELDIAPPAAEAPFELIETRVFDDMRSRGQLHLLEEIRMNIISCYKIIKDYNFDRCYKPHHPDLLTGLHKWLDEGIRDLEARFKFLPRYVKEKDKSTQWEAEG
jgi:uncharacterized membrane protein